MKSARRRDLIRLLHEGSVASQQEIVDALHSTGHDATQATISRDLQELGATKVRSNGGFVYKLPDDIPLSRGGDLMIRNLDKTLAEFAVGIHSAASLVVVSTPPGHASAVARAIDLTGLEDVLGTIAGDDTIFVATSGADVAAVLAERWTNSPAVEGS
ncbi:MAG: transcriptional regulator of arginine metabolism [Actinomycetota bacterium]|nr:transcriptional regulator of arginine metabolism [Actinomycetota bacterium]